MLDRIGFPMDLCERHSVITVGVVGTRTFQKKGGPTNVTCHHDKPSWSSALRCPAVEPRSHARFHHNLFLHSAYHIMALGVGA